MTFENVANCFAVCVPLFCLPVGARCHDLNETICMSTSTKLHKVSKKTLGMGTPWGMILLRPAPITINNEHDDQTPRTVRITEQAMILVVDIACYNIFAKAAVHRE